MNVIWHGLGCFSLQSKQIAGEANIVIDPFDNSVGLRIPKTLQAAIVAQSHDGPMANNTKAVSGMIESNKPFIVTHAGEFEVKGIFVTGIRAPKKDGTEHTIYRINIEGMKIGFLGALDRKLKESEAGNFGNIDILILPIGGKSVLDKSVAQEVIQQIEPRLVIPSHYKLPGQKEDFDGVEGFCKEMACPLMEQNKLKITKSSLPQEDMQIAILAKS